MKIFKKNKAFTLVELLTVIAIMSIVLTMVYQTYTSNMNIVPKASTRSYLQQDVRLASEYITKDLRYARSINITEEKPSSFNSNLVYLYSENNNIKYVKNGVIKNLLSDDPGRTLNLLFSHKVEDGNTVTFTLNGEAKTKYSLDTKVEILNLNDNPIIGLNGYYISFSLTDFDDNAPTITSTNPITVDSGDAIHHYSFTEATTPENSIDISSGSLPTPFSVVPFFTDDDLSTGDHLTYYTTSEFPDIITTAIDSNNKLQFSINTVVTTDTPVKITLSAVDDYGAAVSTYFLVTVIKDTPVTTSEISPSGLSNTVVFYQNTGYRSINLASFFTFTGGNIPEYTATLDGHTFNYNNISTNTIGSSTVSYTISVTATINTVSLTRTINIEIRSITITVEKDGSEIVGDTINITNTNQFNIKISATDSVGNVKVYCSPENNFSGFDGSFNSSTNTYILSAKNIGISEMYIDIYLYGYTNSSDGYKIRTIKVTTK